MGRAQNQAQIKTREKPSGARPHYKLKAQAKHMKEKPHGIPTCNVRTPHGFTQEGANRPHTHVDQVYWTPTPQGGPRLGPANAWLNAQEQPHGVPTRAVRRRCLHICVTLGGASQPHITLSPKHGHQPFSQGGPDIGPAGAWKCSATESAKHRSCVQRSAWVI